jgi:hypothetical protein
MGRRPFHVSHETLLAADLDWAWGGGVVGWQSALDGLAPHSSHPYSSEPARLILRSFVTSISSWRKPIFSQMAPWLQMDLSAIRITQCSALKKPIALPVLNSFP